MDDNYAHIDTNIMYITENIPGMACTDDAEHKNLLTDLNSQLTCHCKCQVTCSVPDCTCLIISGGTNYITHVENGNEVLKLMSINTTTDVSHPVMECNSLCKCSYNCGNRVVQKGPSRHLTIKLCAITAKGYGLFATQHLIKGTFICEYAGEVITKKQALIRHRLNVAKKKMNYIFCLNEYSNNTLSQTIIDPSEFGNIGRYINHSCEPNCIIIPVRIDCPVPKLAIFNIVDIPSDTEITFDYGVHNLDQSLYTANIEDKRSTCLCQTHTCKGFMPFQRY